MPKISIIMPALNVGAYIRECLHSVIEQTLEDIEIIVVDAGSTDGTLEIIKEFALVDKRIQVVHSKIKSYGYQLNLGFSLAKADYIGIVETDDYIMKDMYECLYRICVENNLDYAKGYAMSFYTIGDEKYHFPCNDLYLKEGLANIVLDVSEIPGLFLKDRFLWLGLYKKDLIHKIVLNETKGAAFQDVGFQLQLLMYAKRAMYIDKAIYFYRQDNINSSIHNHNSIGFIVQEYKLDTKYINDKGKVWKSVFYRRMMEQLCARLDRMALEGEFWSESIEDINRICLSLQEAKSNGILTEGSMGMTNWEKLNSLLENPRNIFENSYRQYKIQREKFETLLRKVETKEVIIFGAGRNGIFLERLLKSKKNHVICFCDNSEPLWNTTIDNVPIMSVENSASKYKDAIYVITSVKYKEEMQKQLQNEGICIENIEYYLMGVNVLLALI